MNRHERRARAAKKKKSTATNGLKPTAHVRIGIPSGTHWYAKMAMCTIFMLVNTLTKETPGYGLVDLDIQNRRGSTIWRNRGEIVQMAIEEGRTHVLFVDTDQTFPPNTLRRLLYHKKPVVACNVAIKQVPTMPTARKWVDVPEGRQLYPVFTREDSKGLEEVCRIGTGIMLIRLEDIKDVSRPLFSVASRGELEDEPGYGEDWYFCEKLEAAGIPIYIDHDLSWEVGHIGDMSYEHRFVEQELVDETHKILMEGTPEEKKKLMGTAIQRLSNQPLEM